MTLGKVMICIFIISRNQLAKELFSILEVFSYFVEFCTTSSLKNMSKNHLKVNLKCIYLLSKMVAN